MDGAGFAMMSCTGTSDTGSAVGSSGLYLGKDDGEGEGRLRNAIERKGVVAGGQDAQKGTPIESVVQQLTRAYD